MDQSTAAEEDDVIFYFLVSNKLSISYSNTLGEGTQQCELDSVPR